MELYSIMEEQEEISIFDSKHYKIYKNSVKIIGVWPFQKMWINKITRVLLIIILISLVILQIIRLCEEISRDLDAALELIASLSYFSAALSKYITTIRAQNQFRFLYNRIAYHWHMIKDKNERKILEETTDESQFLCILYMIAAYSSLVVYTTTPAIAPAVLDIIIPLNKSRKKTFPYFAEYFVDTEVHYYKLMAHGTVVFTVSVMICVSIDTMYASCAQHLCGLLAIVEYRLHEAMKTNNNVKLQQKENDSCTYKKVQDAIILHNDSLEFAEAIEKTNAICFLLVMGLNVSVIVFSAVVTIINLGDLKQMIRYILLFGAFSFHLLFNCIPGQKVHDKSISMIDASYSCEWYNASLKSRKLIQFMMHRSLSPCQFTAGGLFVMNLESFGSIMKSCMSYITVISSIR